MIINFDVYCEANKDLLKSFFKLLSKDFNFFGKERIPTKGTRCFVKMRGGAIIAGVFVCPSWEENPVKEYFSTRFKEAKRFEFDQNSLVISSVCSCDLKDEKHVFAELLLDLFKFGIAKKISAFWFYTDRINYRRFCDRFNLYGKILSTSSTEGSLSGPIIAKIEPKLSIVDFLEREIKNGVLDLKY